MRRTEWALILSVGACAGCTDLRGLHARRDIPSDASRGDAPAGSEAGGAGGDASADASEETLDVHATPEAAAMPEAARPSWVDASDGGSDVLQDASGCDARCASDSCPASECGSDAEAGVETGAPVSDCTQETDGTPCGGAGHICLRGFCIESVCSDGFTDPARNEECDDGNTAHSDGCESDCTRTRIRDVVGGDAFLCALFESGGVKCWGSGAYGVLGNGSTVNIWDPSTTPLLDFGTPRRVVEIAAGRFHACVRFEDNRMRCWGYNVHGQLGQGNTEDYGDDPDETLSELGDLNLENVATISASENDTCALVVEPGEPAGSVHCWGYNGAGAMGVGNTQPYGNVQPIDASRPAQLGDARALKLRAFANGACALLENGHARCWGSAIWGTLGDGYTFVVGDGVGNRAGAGLLPDSPSFDVILPPAYDIERIVGMHRTLCSLSTDGAVLCWGSNVGVRAGFRGSDVLPTPQPLDFGTIQVADIGYGLTNGCVLSATGRVYCFGTTQSLGYGGLATVASSELSALPNGGAIDVGDFDGLEGLDPVARLFVTSRDVCALIENGDLRCWTRNEAGQLGLGFATGQAGDPGIGHIGDDETPGEAYEALGVTGIRLFE